MIYVKGHNPNKMRVYNDLNILIDYFQHIKQNAKIFSEHHKFIDFNLLNIELLCSKLTTHHSTPGRRQLTSF